MAAGDGDGSVGDLTIQMMNACWDFIPKGKN